MRKAIQNQQELSAGGLIWASLDMKLNIHKGLKRKALRFLSVRLCARKETQMAEKQIPEEAYRDSLVCMKGVGVQNRGAEGHFHGRMKP